MIQAKEQLLAALGDALAEIAPGAGVEPAFENPKQASHGDLACTVAMQLARPQKKNPRELAAALIAALQARPAVQQWVDALEIAGPGFINIRLKPAARQQVVAQVLADGAGFGQAAANGRKVMVEFVSANPTGPLHVGHGRQGALGDALCNLFAAQGWQVHREFYYNDAGVQIATLAHSTQCRLKGLKPGDAAWPESAYNGDYIQDIADAFMARATVKADDREFTASGDPDDLDGIRQFAVAYLRHEQDLDLRAFGVKFDHYYLESSLYTSGRVEEAVAKLVAAGKTFEEGGALWLRSTDYGDDKDRVIRKSDGGLFCQPLSLQRRGASAAGAIRLFAVGEFIQGYDRRIYVAIFRFHLCLVHAGWRFYPVSASLFLSSFYSADGNRVADSVDTRRRALARSPAFYFFHVRSSVGLQEYRLFRGGDCTDCGGWVCFVGEEQWR